MIWNESLMQLGNSGYGIAIYVTLPSQAFGF